MSYITLWSDNESSRDQKHTVRCQTGRKAGRRTARNSTHRVLIVVKNRRTEPNLSVIAYQEHVLIAGEVDSMKCRNKHQ